MDPINPNPVPNIEPAIEPQPAVLPATPEVLPITSEPTVATPPPPQSPKKSHKKLFSLIGLLVVLLIAATAGVFAFINLQKSKEPTAPIITSSPSPEAIMENEMDDWHIYKSSNFRYALEYPPEWEIHTQEVDPTGNWSSANLLNISSPGTVFYEGEPDIEMTISVNVLKSSHYNVTDQVSGYNTDSFGGENIKVENFSVGEMNGTLVSMRNSIGGVDRKALFIQKDDLIYHIDLLWESNKPDYEDIVNQILSSFEFTEQEWINYTNTKYKYSFDYPINWVVQDENTKSTALPTSDTVLVFDPKIPLDHGFSGIKITYSGGLIDTSGLQQTWLNNVPTTVYTEDTLHGKNYYANISDTDQFLYITGASGDTEDETLNNVLRRIFSTFKIHI